MTERSPAALTESLRQTISPDIGLDLGTANTVAYERTQGVIISQPSVVAYNIDDDRIIAVGHAAKEIEGRAPHKVRVVRPLRRGTISDFHAAEALVADTVDRALAARPRLGPRIVASIPGCATDIECKAVEQAVRLSGARWATFVPQAVAAAVGAGLDVTSPQPMMVVDIGGGTTEIGIIGLSGVLRLHSVQVGGDDFDRAIQNRVRAKNFVIGSATAESIKIQLGFAGRAPGRAPLTVHGSDLELGGAPGSRLIDEALVGAAMRESIERIARAVCSVLETTQPDVAGDLLESGITLTGGGALIANLAGEIGMRTNVPTTVAPDPLLCVARGAGEILGSPSLLERVRPSADKLTRWYQSLRIGMRESYSP
jgi:rod shape-determining protein MreB